MDYMEQEKTQQTSRPVWAQGRQIDEILFCQDFASQYNLTYADGCFYSWRGPEPEEDVRRWIYQLIRDYYSTRMNQRVSQLTEILKMELHQPQTLDYKALVQCQNGCYSIVQESFMPTRVPCRCRLPVDYNPQAPRPEIWLNFLEELREPEDILTLQEFMGYCLIPVNYGQKMLMIIGSGGEGKSRIGIILHALLGKNMANGSLTKLEKNQFARADLQNRLVMVDDDLQMEALTATGILKSIITAEQPMDLERKGKQSYQGELYCRLMAFGNGSLRALHDRSHGFFRRQIILTTKPRREDREDDPYLAAAMKQELEGILMWCIQGLQRLVHNDFQFTVSQRSRENLAQAMKEGNNTLDFMASEGYIRLDQEAEISSRRLYSIYTDWCHDNMAPPLSSRSFIGALITDAHRYGITYTNRINGGNGRLVRGFRGIRGLSRA